ncbi:membrane protein [Pseudoduganella dura]|nr:membrane protein [Pseudoduganella dura]
MLAALAAGLLFGVGLILSGMTEPAKVAAFLDLAGSWDPSLLCVMLGAIAVAAPAFRIAARRKAAITGAPMQLPRSRRIDRPLVVGSLAFGVGWGIAGYCPGPALASLSIGGAAPWLFVPAMVAGMAVFELAEWMRASVSAKSPG